MPLLTCRTCGEHFTWPDEQFAGMEMCQPCADKYLQLQRAKEAKDNARKRRLAILARRRKEKEREQAERRQAKA